jgi:hypothetical protein
MHYAFPFLPLEVQTSIKELIALGNLPESVIDLHIERLSHALEQKTINAQRQVVDIEQSMERRVERIGQAMAEKVSADLQTQNGVTNGMISDTYTLVQQQGAAVTGLRAEFQAFGEAVSERLTGVENRTDALELKVAQHDQSRDQSIQERLLLRQDMDESKKHRAHLQERLDRELPAIHRSLTELAEAVQRIEQLLEIAGQHEAGS